MWPTSVRDCRCRDSRAAVGVRPAEVRFGPPHGAGRLGHVERSLSLGRGEVGGGAHRMHWVVDDIDGTRTVGAGAVEAGWIGRVAAHHVDPSRQGVRRASFAGVRASTRIRIPRSSRTGARRLPMYPVAPVTRQKRPIRRHRGFAAAGVRRETSAGRLGR